MLAIITRRYHVKRQEQISDRQDGDHAIGKIPCRCLATHVLPHAIRQDLEDRFPDKHGDAQRLQREPTNVVGAVIHRDAHGASIHQDNGDDDGVNNGVPSAYPSLALLHGRRYDRSLRCHINDLVHRVLDRRLQCELEASHVILLSLWNLLHQHLRPWSAKLHQPIQAEHRVCQPLLLPIWPSMRQVCPRTIDHMEHVNGPSGTPPRV
mmetsp:Transcript_126767/g.366950  ORF Transcript_126767/g.366950 Transcript_126767/m.366950 type:complete len:208 (-) Transcript_126767:569-1192(-)